LQWLLKIPCEFYTNLWNSKGMREYFQ
jgi:hypothetical protein